MWSPPALWGLPIHSIPASAMSSSSSSRSCFAHWADTSNTTHLHKHWGYIISALGSISGISKKPWLYTPLCMCHYQCTNLKNYLPSKRVFGQKRLKVYLPASKKRSNRTIIIWGKRHIGGKYNGSSLAGSFWQDSLRDLQSLLTVGLHHLWVGKLSAWNRLQIWFCTAVCELGFKINFSNW